MTTLLIVLTLQAEIDGTDVRALPRPAELVPSGQPVVEIGGIKMLKYSAGAQSERLASDLAGSRSRGASRQAYGADEIWAPGLCSLVRRRSRIDSASMQKYCGFRELPPQRVMSLSPEARPSHSGRRRGVRA